MTANANSQRNQAAANEETPFLTHYKRKLIVFALDDTQSKMQIPNTFQFPWHHSLLQSFAANLILKFVENEGEEEHGFLQVRKKRKLPKPKAGRGSSRPQSEVQLAISKEASQGHTDLFQRPQVPLTGSNEALAEVDGFAMVVPNLMTKSVYWLSVKISAAL